MKKILLLFLFLIFLYGCEKDFDSTIDTQTYSYQVTNLSSFSSFRYLAGDSVITVFLALSSSSGIENVFFDIYASDDSKLNDQGVQLLDNGDTSIGDQAAGDNIYTNKFPLSRTYPIGLYSIKFFVTDQGNTTKQVAVHNFTYDNGQTNFAPVISNLVAPDTAFIEPETNYIFLSVDVLDENGLNDIEFVFFNSFIPPDGHPSSGNPIKMYDDGTNGDHAIGDGTFSAIVILPPTGVEKGTYRWEFQARDRGGLVSSKIIHNIVVE